MLPSVFAPIYNNRGFLYVSERTFCARLLPDRRQRTSHLVFGVDVRDHIGIVVIVYRDVIIAILHTLGFQGEQPVPEGLRLVPSEVREELYVLIGPEQLICK
jgi:hypothetical protein